MAVLSAKLNPLNAAKLLHLMEGAARIRSADSRGPGSLGSNTDGGVHSDSDEHLHHEEVAVIARVILYHLRYIGVPTSEYIFILLYTCFTHSPSTGFKPAGLNRD